MAPRTLDALADKIDLRQMELDESGGGRCGKGPRWCAEAYTTGIDLDAGLPSTKKHGAKSVLRELNAVFDDQGSKLLTRRGDGLDLGVEPTASGPVLRRMDHRHFAKKEQGAPSDRVLVMERFVAAIGGPDDTLPGYFQLAAPHDGELEKAAKTIEAVWRHALASNGLQLVLKDSTPTLVSAA